MSCLHTDEESPAPVSRRMYKHYGCYHAEVMYAGGRIHAYVVAASKRQALRFAAKECGMKFKQFLALPKHLRPMEIG